MTSSATGGGRRRPAWSVRASTPARCRAAVMVPPMTRLTKGARSVAGRVAVITGAASGMGGATAHLFADDRAQVAVPDRTEHGVPAVRGEVTGPSGTADRWAGDRRQPHGRPHGATGHIDDPP